MHCHGPGHTEGWASVEPSTVDREMCPGARRACYRRLHHREEGEDDCKVPLAAYLTRIDGPRGKRG